MDQRKPNSIRQIFIAETAVEWLARLPSASARDRLAFWRWLKRSPDHVREILQASSTDVVLRAFFQERAAEMAALPSRHAIATDSPATDAVQERTRLRFSKRAGLGVAAALALLAVLLTTPSFDAWLNRDVYATVTGDQQQFTLEDGSAISLNAKSRMRVRFSEQQRDVYLLNGQALFSVAKDPMRPFRVHVGSNLVQAVGTKFDVQMRAQRTVVAVIDGVVQVAAGTVKAHPAQLANPTQVAAGQGVSVATDGSITAPAPINVAEASAWLRGKLVFRDNTLEEIAAEFALYNNKPQLRVEGATLRARRLSGTFNAYDPEAVAKSLVAVDETIEIERQGDEIVIRMRAASASRIG